MNSVCENVKLSSAEFLNNTAVLSCFPRLVNISLTNVCQQRCRFCGYKHEEVVPTFVPYEVIEKMTWIRYATRIMLCGNGEVLMHPDYVRILKKVRRMAPDSEILVYTNGLGLTGAKLEATVRYADSVHVSQNAIREDVYNQIIYKGNYKLAMENLKNLSKLKKKSMRVYLSLVAVREAVPDIKNFIDLAADYGFNEVRVISAREPLNAYDYCLGRESFEGVVQGLDFCDLKKYACSKGIEFPEVSLGPWGVSVCTEPFFQMHFNIRETGKVYLSYCYRCSLNVTVDMENMHDIDKVWNNPRAQFLRTTVNDEEKVLANKLCMSCRSVNFYLSSQEVIDQLVRLRVTIDNNRPEYFPYMHIE